jgi:phosphatidylinositol alpha 1,6-mannosyltransferase
MLVGYVGRLAPEKQVERLAVLAGLPGVRLVVVGSGPSEQRLRDALPQAAFLGFLDGDDLSRLYASLDVFVHTGPSETFCRALTDLDLRAQFASAARRSVLRRTCALPRGADIAAAEA